MLRMDCHWRASSGAFLGGEWSPECGHPSRALRFASVEGSRQHRNLTVSFHLNGYCAQDQTDRVSTAGERLLSSPITGIAGCCARAASGHATAAPPTVAKNFRRPMWLAM